MRGFFLYLFIFCTLFPSPVFAAVVSTLSHESGTLSEYSLTSTDGGDLSVMPQAGLAGTGYGIRVLIDDGVRIYASKALTTPSTTGVVRARFYFQPNTLFLGAMYEQISFIFFGNASGTSNFAQLKIMNLGGGTYHVRGVMIDDNEAHRETVETWPVSNTQHYMELLVKRATSANTNDGSLEVWMDGVKKTTMTGVDSYAKFSDLKYISVGLINAGGTISGAYYIDEIVVNNDGSPIGPIGQVPNPTPSPTQGVVAGDATNDGHVNASDFVVWKNNFGNVRTGSTNADFDANGIIDGRDFIIWLTNFGR